MSPTQWAEVKLRAEQGESYEAIANLYPITAKAIDKRCQDEKWSTPRRVNKALRGELPEDDPAQAAANVWRTRKAEARETVFQGARKSLERFFAMAPIPQSFSEAAIAHKLMSDSISPPEEQENKGSINLAILTQVGFQPRIQED
jgi:hypothetical protein